MDHQIRILRRRLLILFPHGSWVVIPYGTHSSRQKRASRARDLHRLQRRSAHSAYPNSRSRTLRRPRPGTRAQAPPAMLAERHGRRGSQATWPPGSAFTGCRAGGLRPVRGKPAPDLLWRLADGDCLMGVQLGLMGVQLGGMGHPGRFARLRLRCGNCRAAAGGCHRASLMIKRSEAAAAVRARACGSIPADRPGRFRSSHAWTGREGRHCRLFTSAKCGPAGPFRVSLDW